MSLFDFSQEELLTFFAVMVRYSVLIAVLPFTGDRMVPAPAKILLALAVTIALFPALVSSGQVKPGEAIGWASSAAGIAGTVALEALLGFGLGYVARLTFDAIHFGSNLAGNFMGFASASTYDPHQESQTQVVAEVQMALAMLLFLALDGHHLMLRAALDSYAIVGLGKAGITGAYAQHLTELTAQVLRFAISLSAPIAAALFAVNVAFGIMAKAMPQMNVLVLSFAASAFVGLAVMFLSVPELNAVSAGIFGRMDEWMGGALAAMAGR